MARRQQYAEYVCVTNCTFEIENEDGKKEVKFFRAGNNVEENKGKFVEGGPGEHDYLLTVPQGTLVCKHFAPYNEIAEDDREDQVANPNKYIKTENDIILIAEFMVAKGLVQHEKGLSKVTGKVTVTKPAKDIAVEMIKKYHDIKDEDIAVQDETVERERAIQNMLKWGDSEKEQRVKIGKVLKENEVKYFPGLKPEVLAGMVFDEGLYKAE